MGLFSFAALYQAYLVCRRRKRQTRNTQRFEQYLLDNLFDLQEQLSSACYQPSRSVCFVVTRPKLREIFAADFRDRVVHHLLVPRLEAIYEPKFISDSYACRQGKGAHAAVDRLQQLMKAAISRAKGRRVWFLQLDIRSFFMAIDKDVLLALVARQVKDPALLALTQQIIQHDPTTSFVRKGAAILHRQVPQHKSLFGLEPGKGLPIGNLTSQFLANVYLNELDQYVKHQLKVRNYLRYVDDFILIDEDPAVLLQHKARIESFLSEHLALQLKPGAQPRPISAGADFLGFILRPDYRLVRKRVVGNLRARLNDFQRDNLRTGAIGRQPFWHLQLRPGTAPVLRQVLASHLGHFRHANSYRLVQTLFGAYPWLGCLFDVSAATRPLVCRFMPSQSPAHLAQQYAWFATRFQGYCLFFQVGGFIEFYGRQAEDAVARFALKPGDSRHGLGACCGFPLRLLKRYKERARQLQLAYVVIAQTGQVLKTGIQRRELTEFLTFDLQKPALLP
jgi:retron-type reverse transcriptase